MFVQALMPMLSLSACKSLSTSAPERRASLEFGAGAEGRLMRGYGGIDWGSSVEEVLKKKGNDLREFTGLQPPGESMLIEDVEEGRDGGGGIERVYYMFVANALASVVEVYGAGEICTDRVDRALRALYPGEVHRRGPGQWMVGGVVQVSIGGDKVLYEVSEQQ